MRDASTGHPLQDDMCDMPAWQRFRHILASAAKGIIVTYEGGAVSIGEINLVECVMLSIGVAPNEGNDPKGCAF
jgi:hypothetical protein